MILKHMILTFELTQKNLKNTVLTFLLTQKISFTLNFEFVAQKDTTEVANLYASIV